MKHKVETDAAFDGSGNFKGYWDCTCECGITFKARAKSRLNMIRTGNSKRWIAVCPDCGQISDVVEEE